MERKKRVKEVLLSISIYMILPNIILVNYFNQDFGILSLKSLCILAIILGLMSVLLGGLITLITKKPYYSAIVLGFFWIVFWKYNDLYGCMSSIGITSKYLLPLISIGVLLMIIIFKKIKGNYMLSIVVPIFIIIIFVVNMLTFISRYIVYINNDIPYENVSNNIVVDSSLPTPNIYWIHCDGMMSFSSIDEYFGYDNTELHSFLEQNDFFISESASMEVGHLTMQALPALTCPNYYDMVLKDYFTEKQHTYFDNSTVNKLVYTSDLVNAKINNELVEELKLREYQINIIAENGGEFSFYGDNYYRIDAEDMFIEHPREKSMFFYELEVNILPLLVKETIICPFYNMMKHNDYLEVNEIDNTYFNVSENEKLIRTRIAFDDVIANNNVPKFSFITLMTAHAPFEYDENGNNIETTSYEGNPDDYVPAWKYTEKLIMELVEEIQLNDSNAIIIVEGDHGCHLFTVDMIREQWPNATEEDILNIWNSVMSAVYIPEMYQNEDTKNLDNPLNISRFIVNSYIGQNYEYL